MHLDPLDLYGIRHTLTEDERLVQDAVARLVADPEVDVVVTAIVNWLMGEEHLDPAWNFGPAGERFEVEVVGDPPALVTFKGWQPETVEEGLVRNPGVVATAMHCVNAVPYVCRAEPGIRTYLDLPIIAGRAAPGLAR